MKVTILGCGTSGGVPRMPEHWGACDPNNPKNRRRRASIMVEEGATRLIVDTSPDLREQMLAAKVDGLDAVLYSHDHADHTHGIDDLRGFYMANKSMIPLYGDRQTLASLMHKFAYIFEGRNGYPAVAAPHEITGAFTIGDIGITPFLQGHGRGTSLGFRMDDMAYSTDVSALSEEAFETLAGVTLWIVDALGHEPHPTHSHLAQTLAWIARVSPKRAVLTHMAWNMDYQSLAASLPKGVEPAYDGMTLEL